MKTYVLSYNQYSNGARQVAAGLGLPKPRVKGQLGQAIEQQVPAPDKVNIINWGSGASTNYITSRAFRFVNPVSVINLCSNKLKFFQKLAGVVRTPDFTDNVDTALEWARDSEVLGRELKGTCGLDIVFYSDDPVTFATKDFWVRYKKKKAEFRVHVMNGDVLFTQKKVLRTTDLHGEPIPQDSVDFRVRNLRNGFIFQRYDFTVPDDVIDQAKAAIEQVGADFGAVDVIYNEYEQKAYVLEINTAPGLEGSSVDAYVKGFRELLGA